MERPRILCLDVGHKRTGVAVCDETRTLASPVEVLDSTNRKVLIANVVKRAEELGVGTIVVGLPLDQEGDVGRDAVRVRHFIAALREKTSLAVLEWDERFSTVEAERTLIEADFSREERRKVIDKVAATIILQSYIDHLKFHDDK
ncbi:MAG: Holliday junction resolvase RuvX [Deltaproteobacteria bacterium]|nr:Holliday junction resolvase RuvX [Deltaproteobacteria bacterium]MBI3295104.1 Holliday junction resolvase RuvX [Deltaproteobacteria bacterium]